MSKPKPSRYRTTNWSDYNAALQKHGSLLIWLDNEMAWLATHDGRPGRPAVFSDAAIQFCLSIKGIRPVEARSQAFSGRQFQGMRSSMRLILLSGKRWRTHVSHA